MEPYARNWVKSWGVLFYTERRFTWNFTVYPRFKQRESTLSRRSLQHFRYNVDKNVATANSVKASLFLLALRREDTHFHPRKVFLYY